MKTNYPFVRYNPNIFTYVLKFKFEREKFRAAKKFRILVIALVKVVSFTKSSFICLTTKVIQI